MPGNVTKDVGQYLRDQYVTPDMLGAKRMNKCIETETPIYCEYEHVCYILAEYQPGETQNDQLSPSYR